MWISQFRDKTPTASHILKYSWVLMATTEHRCQIQKVLGFYTKMDKLFSRRNPHPAQCQASGTLGEATIVNSSPI